LHCNHYSQLHNASKEQFFISDEFEKDDIAPFTKNEFTPKGQNSWDRFNNRNIKSDKRSHFQGAKEKCSIGRDG